LSPIQRPLVVERRLVLVRHGESEGNRRNVFTGRTDLDLTERGVAEAHAVARSLAAEKTSFGTAFVSALVRARRTAAIVLADLGQGSVPVVSDAALNERDYGALTGLNKDEARARWGEDQVRTWRRSYAVAPPEGESLRDTLARVLPFYLATILPAVMRGATVLVVAHGNSLRALVMALDQLTPEAITSVELSTGDILIYDLAEDTTVRSKRVIPASGPDR
jgi:2,3-bisphosphoglycerate-dependent phosphoglycerate mutase